MSMHKSDLEVVESFCLWCDLLGYGKAFYDSNWELSTEASYANLKRIKNLEISLQRIPTLEDRMLSLNDGFIHNLDFSNLKILNIIYWLEFSLENFLYANRLDIASGFYGIRGVLTYGQRAKYTTNGLTLSDLILTDNSKRKAAYEKVQVTYSPSEFQMNTAFSKAYIIEADGSKKGISGNKLYIDIQFINKLVSIINNHEGTVVVGDIESIEEKVVTFFADFNHEENILVVGHYLEEVGIHILLQIWFNENTVIYDNQSKNIHTLLYTPSKMRAAREPDYIHDFNEIR